MEKPTVFMPAREPFKSVTEDLTKFVHRVALNENPSQAEIAALSAVAEVLYKYGNYGYEGS